MEIILILCVVIIIVVSFKKYSERGHGTAQLRTKSPLFHSSNTGFMVNGKDRISIDRSRQHFAVMAQSGGLKSQSVILPNLFNLTGSAICLDLKGELSDLSARYLADKKGYKIQEINLFDVNKSQRYNPLKWLRSDVDIRKFAQMLVNNNSSESEESFWKNGAIQILEMLIRCLVNTEDEECINLANLIHLLDNFDASNQCKRLQVLIAALNSKGNNHDTDAMFRHLRFQEPKTLAGWLATARNAVAPFNNKFMKTLTAKNEIDFISLREQKTVLYVKCPAGMIKTYSPFLQIFYSQMFDTFLKTPLEEGDLDIFALLDEAGVAGRIGNLPEVISLIRSQRVSICLVCQNYQQFRKTYGNDATTILANCASKILFPGCSDVLTLREFESLLGVETLREWDEDNQRVQTYRRSLFNPDEIRTLKKGTALFIHGNADPVLMRLYPLFSNYRLLRKAKLKSVDGRLVNTQSSLEVRSRNLSLPPLIDLDRLNQRLEQYLGTEEALEPSVY